jgi:putative transposase
MPRIARIIYVGYPHHIVQRGNNKQTVFFVDADREEYLKFLNKYANECGCILNSYCLMKNHIHLLLNPKQQNSLSKTMQKLSLKYTQYINKKYKRTGRLWECRFHSCVVEKEVYLWSVCRYIERNPVRAGIVEKAIQYKWSSAKANTNSDYKNKLIEPIWKDYFERDEYKKFLSQSDDKEEIEKLKKSTFSGIPSGSEKFIQHIEREVGISLIKRKKGRPKKISC